MAATIASGMPEKFIAGDTVKFYHAEADYPPDDGWSLAYTLSNGSAELDVTAADNGDGRWLVTISATDSATLAAGDWRWHAAASKSGERFTVGRGAVRVQPDLIGGTNADDRGHVKKTIDALEAVIEQRASKDQQQYSIQGRMLIRMPIGELLKWRDKYRAEYQRILAAERLEQGKGSRRKVLTRFVR